MCDASDSMAGAVLGQRVDKRPVVEINETFPDEQFLAGSTAPWYAHFINSLATGAIPEHCSKKQRQQFMAQVKQYIWDEPDLFKVGANQVLRRCLPENKVNEILKHAHSLACGGYFSGSKMGYKVLTCGFYWPRLFKDANEYAWHFLNCQRMRGITKRNEMPLQPILVVDIFDIWGMDIMGPSELWVEAVAKRTNDHSVVCKFVQSNIFSTFGVPRVIISDGGSHFKNFTFSKLLECYSVNLQIATPSSNLWSS
ncbi:uncharacterized protein LOC143537711 [Bidens hawaiensis]|uniref:uncharacterized protein LOC143537711 n=1 Tax=Bidens hawaiensis TaxID=980011 RepID=UPI00404AE058